MTKFVELTRQDDGEKMWVNPLRVEAVKAYDNGSRLHMILLGAMDFIETPDVIVELLNAADVQPIAEPTIDAQTPTT